MNKSLLTSAVLLACSISQAQAIDYASTGNNFSMLGSDGSMIGGTNDVVMKWDGTKNTSITDTNFNMSLSSTSPFFDNLWTAHHTRVFGPGTYTFDTGCSVNEIDAGTTPCTDVPLCTEPVKANCPAGSDQHNPLVMTVGAGEIGAHMIFDWNGPSTIDVVNVWASDAIFSIGECRAQGGTGNGMWCEAGLTAHTYSGVPSTLWHLASTDDDSDGIPSVAMADGPFSGSNANFNLMVFIANQVPEAYSASLVINEDSVGSGKLVATDVDNDPITYRIDTNAANGVAIVTNNADGSYTYTPNTGFFGSDSFTFIASDKDGDSAPATVSITVTEFIPQPRVLNYESTGNNFTMLSPTGTLASGMNNVAMTWDGTSNTSVTGTNFNMTLASTTPLLFTPFTAHHIRVFGPGTYTFDSGCTPAELDAGTASCTADAGHPHTPITMTIGTSQVGVHMLFDLIPTSPNIDVLNVWEQKSVYSVGTGSSINDDTGDNMWDGADTTTDPWSADPTNSWSLASTDNDGDGVLGIKMVDAITSFAGNFNLMLTPINNAPICDDGVLTINKDTVGNGSLPCSEYDGDVATFALVDPATNGTVTLDDDSTGVYTYIPDVGFSGSDSFTFKMSDKDGDSDIKSVVVVVNAVCPGDFDQDGDVDGRDVSVIIPQIGRSDCSVSSPCSADFDNDGDVDGGDIAVFVQDLGRTDCPVTN